MTYKIFNSVIFEEPCIKTLTKEEISNKNMSIVPDQMGTRKGITGIEKIVIFDRKLTDKEIEQVRKDLLKD